MSTREAEPRSKLLTSDITPVIGWLVGMVFAIFDVLTTWYALDVLHLQSNIRASCFYDCECAHRDSNGGTTTHDRYEVRVICQCA